MQTTKKALVGSNGNQFFGTDGKEDRCLNVRYLEDNIALSIHGLSTDQASNSKYDYKTGNEIYLKGKNAKSLCRLIADTSSKLINGENIKSKSISSGANMIKVCDGLDYCPSKGLTLVIYNGIDPESKLCDKFAIFQFRNDIVISDYNEKTGTYNTDAIDADVDYFLDTLKAFVKASSNAYSHFNKKEFKWAMDGYTSRQFKLMEAMGIKVETLRSGNKPDWNGGSSSGGYKAVIDSADDLVNELIAD